MTLVYGSIVVDYVSERLNFKPEGTVTAIGIQRQGIVKAGAIFSFYTGSDIDVTIATEPRCLSRGFIRAIAHYVFHQAGCVRASFMTEQASVVTVARRMGMQIEGIKRNAYGPGRNGVMLGLLREEWQALEYAKGTART